ncbi:MAG: carboxypeptidase regulatory-like domain-containing protein, partial [Candidatus Auribacterota bacterium]|nr:carboxypeptidase regulatory-like domain-containing protein [Candidatus Auribacterota bacterium]
TGGCRSYYVPRKQTHETDSQGLCVIEDLPRKPLRVRVAADGYEPVSRLRVAEGQDKVEIVLKKGGAITGRLVDSGGEAVKKIKVRAKLQKKDPFDYNFDFMGRHRPVNLGKGYFKIKNLKAGDYDLKIKCPGLALKEIDDLEVNGGEETNIGEIKLQPEGIITGRVVRSGTGEPIRRTWARVQNLGIRSSRLSQTMKDPGRFQLNNIPPGTYTIVVEAKNYTDKDISGITVSAGEKKELAPVELEKMTPAEIEEKRRERGFIPSLGIRVGKSEEPEDFIGLPVGEVKPGSAAADAGLTAGDTIVRVNGKTFFDAPGSFMKGIMGKPGTAVKLTVKRKDSKKERVVNLTIGEWNYEKAYQSLNR